MAPARVGGSGAEFLAEDENSEEGEEFGEEFGEEGEEEASDEENAWMDGSADSIDSVDVSVQSESTDDDLDEIDREALRRAAAAH